MITAKIAPDGIGDGIHGLWLTIENSEDHDEDIDYAVTEEEIPAILEACNKYLEEHETI